VSTLGTGVDPGLGFIGCPGLPKYPIGLVVVALGTHDLGLGEQVVLFLHDHRFLLDRLGGDVLHLLYLIGFDQGIATATTELALFRKKERFALRAEHLLRPPGSERDSMYIRMPNCQAYAGSTVRNWK
jgi:hypothetical protein